jgi:hypothetical protein
LGFQPRPVKNNVRADSSPDPSSARTKCKNKISFGFAKSFSPENSFGKKESVFRPADCRKLGGRTPKENALSFFKKNSSARKSKKQGAFSFGVAE